MEMSGENIGNESCSDELEKVCMSFVSRFRSA